MFHRCHSCCSRVYHFYGSKKRLVVIYYLQAGALVWRFQICTDHPILIYSILSNIEWHSSTNYLLQNNSPRFSLRY